MIIEFLRSAIDFLFALPACLAVCVFIFSWIHRYWYPRLKYPVGEKGFPKKAKGIRRCPVPNAIEFSTGERPLKEPRNQTRNWGGACFAFTDETLFVWNYLPVRVRRVFKPGPNLAIRFSQIKKIEFFTLWDNMQRMRIIYVVGGKTEILELLPYNDKFIRKLRDAIEKAVTPSASKR